MSVSARRGGVGQQPGRALIRAGLFCFTAAGCTGDPPPALLTLIEPERMVLLDSELLPDSARAAIRSYMSRTEDSVWGEISSPEMARLVGENRGLTALLNPAALPAPGRTVAVLVDVPDVGFTEFRLGRATKQQGAATTFVGQAKRGAMSILLLQDSIVFGRITTARGVFDFRSGRYGLINVAPADTTGTLPALYLIPAPAAAETAAISRHTTGDHASLRQVTDADD